LDRIYEKITIEKIKEKLQDKMKIKKFTMNFEKKGKGDPEFKMAVDLNKIDK
jgi:hypothetical protein